MIEKIPIFIINLKKDIEKKEHMQELCKKYSLECQFVDAVYGKDLSSHEIEKVYNKKKAILLNNRELALGEIGCALSHMTIYQKMVDENIRVAMILEDDITFDNSIHNVSSAIDQFTDDWECVLLSYYRGTHYKRNYCFHKQNQIVLPHNLKLVRFTQPMHSTAGYLINISGAKKLLKELEKGINKPIDHYTGNENHLNIYGLFPKVIEIDQIFGEQSSIAIERSSTSKNENGIRYFLKKIGLFKLVKKINIKRQKVFVPIEHILYLIMNYALCSRSPKPYKKSIQENKS